MNAGTDTRNAADDRLVVYSAAEEKYCEALLDGFRRREPGIEVDFRFGISVDLHRRYCAETQAGKPQADVVWSSAMDLQMSLARAGDALPHASAEAAALPRSAIYRDLAYATTAEPLLTLVNRERFDARIPAGSLDEITRALTADIDRFRGRIAGYDIERNGLGFLALLHESQCESEFGGFLDAVRECEQRSFGSNPPLVEEVASGRAALAYHVLASYALRAVRVNPAVAIGVSQAPPLAVSRIVFISKHAPHPRAAGCFVDYLLSLEGQRALLEAGLFPIHPELAGRSGHGRTLRTMRIDDGFDRLLDDKRRREVLDRWRAAMRAS